MKKQFKTSGRLFKKEFKIIQSQLHELKINLQQQKKLSEKRWWINLGMIIIRLLITLIFN